MPPRYAYWTILVDEQPTAFRASSQEDLMPTFKRLQQKNPSAKMMWWQNGKLWNSRLDAQEAMRARGEMGRRGDERQAGGFRDRKRQDAAGGERRDASGKLEWKPKSAGADRGPRKSWAPKKESWAPKRASWSPKRESWAPKKESWSKGPRSSARAPRESTKLEWRPKGSGASRSQDVKTSRPQDRRTSSPQDRKPSRPRGEWLPKEEYKKSQGIEARRDKNWRPGGEHKDPRQKYKDAKKAKWTRFKQNIRQKWEAKGVGPKKKRDE